MVSLKCSTLFFAHLVGKTATPHVGTLTTYCLLSEKETFEKAVPHLKNSHGPVSKSELSGTKVSEERNYTADQVPARVNCRSKVKPVTNSACLRESLAGNRTEITAEKGQRSLRASLPADHACVTATR